MTRLVLMDAPVPSIGPWEEIFKNPLLWHFRFGGPDMERLMAGRERIYLDRFWNDFSAANVQGAVIAGSGHWLMEEQPAATVVTIRNFLDGPSPGR